MREESQVIVNSNQQADRYFNRMHIIFIGIIGVLTLGIVMGYAIFYKFGPIAKNCQIEYISQDEVISLEKKRIEHENGETDRKNLFFGKGKEAIELMAKFAAARQTRDTKVLFTSGAIKSDNVRSISKEIHELVIKELKINNRN